MRLLAKLDHTAVEAADGVCALACYEESLTAQLPFDAIFMDSLMPNMDGE